MKKRILSFFLAVITVLQIMPLWMLPIIAENGISVSDMEVGKLYRAVWNYESYSDVYLYKIDSEDNTKMEQFYGTITKESLPQDLTVKLNEEGDTFVYVTNEDWPAVYEDYRYVEDYELIILEKIEEEPAMAVGITYNGKPVKELPLFEDSKLPITAHKPEEITGDVSWIWEILIGDTWIEIGDKTSATCDVSYALVKSGLNGNGTASLRAKVTNGETTATSDPIEVKMSYYVKAGKASGSLSSIATAPVLLSAQSSAGTNTMLLASQGGASAKPMLLSAGNTTQTITITVKFIKVINGEKIEVAYPDIRTLPIDYESYTVNCPTVLGYTATGATNGTITVPAGRTSEEPIEVIYAPRTDMQYTVNHWKQNVDNDEYTLDQATKGTGTVDATVGACDIELEGFEHLYYERPTIAPDGTTVVDIYYDRVYYQVLFNYDGVQASGQNNAYLRYEDDLLVNNLEAVGGTYIFEGWTLTDVNGEGTGHVPEGVLASIEPNAANKTTKVLGKLTYTAQWRLGKFDYTILFWAENANDGNYSLWYTQHMENEEEKEVIVWDDSFLDILEAYDADTSKNPNPNQLQYFTFNDPKTKEEIGAGVQVKGDGSSVVNVYYSRRYYQITFVGATPSTGCGLDVHTHGDGTCEFNPMYCTHAHTESCKTTNCGIEEHVHTAECKSCTQIEHMHTPECCGVHTHTKDCYNSNIVSDFNSTFKEVASDKIEAYVRQNYGGTSGLGGIISWIVNAFVNEQASNYATQYGEAIQQAAPPQNLQNGYVYVLKNQSIPIKYDGWIINIDTSVPMDIPAVYVDGVWYYYTAPAGTTPETGDIIETDSSKCTEPDHDHTGGCDSANCTNGGNEHVHSDENGCYGCGKVEHEHSAYCGCDHEHTVDCYGYLCMKPEHNHSADADTTTEKTIRVIQAKYGQDITAYVPYFLELAQMNLHMRNGTEYFTYWKYDSTGTDTSKAIDRYVKHVTMVPELCYSNGITTRAQYSSNVTPYVLYYLFESFDQSSSAKEFGSDGSGRQQYSNGGWYDSDPTHMQIIALDNTDAAALEQLKKEGVKTIDGMHVVSTDPQTGALTIEGIACTLNAYYYDRDRIDVDLYNPGGGDPIASIPDIPYGTSISDLQDDILETLDVTTLEEFEGKYYPTTYEAGFYEFSSWYSTPQYAEISEINWATDVVTTDNRYLYARWLGVEKTVQIFTDSTKTTLVDLENEPGRPLGSQTVRYRDAAEEPIDHSTLNPAYNTTDAQYYTFVGWFYEEDGQEKAFDFSFPILDDMQIYPKWASSKKMEYTVYYKIGTLDAEGNLVVSDEEIAAPDSDTAILKQNVTVFAKTNDQLYPEYRDKAYFPQYGSSNIHITSDPEQNTYTFVYIMTKQPIQYRVEYVDEATGDQLLPELVEETMKNAETKQFMPIEGYTVDKYAKTLTLVYYDGDFAETPNVITFYYTKNEEHEPQKAPWVINHYTANLDGETYTLLTDHTKEYEDIISSEPEANGQLYGGQALSSVTGFTLDKVVAVITVDGVTSEVELTPDASGNYTHTLNEYGMAINFYYKRINVSYTVQYVLMNENGTETHLWTDPTYYEAVFESTVTASPNEDKRLELLANGYVLHEGSQSVSLVINIEPERNVLKFRFMEDEVQFIYEIVCPDENHGVNLTPQSREEIASNADQSKIIGATPVESDNYYFAGWFTDPECTVPATENVVIEEGTNRLIPQKVSFKYNGQDHLLFMGGTYYALFLPRSADLTINVSSGQGDSFILTFTGVAGTFAEGTTFIVVVHDGVSATVTDVPIGQYTVVSDSNWSWRYGQINTTVEVVVSVGGALNINASVAEGNDKWLTGDTYGSITP